MQVERETVTKIHIDKVLLNPLKIRHEFFGTGFVKTAGIQRYRKWIPVHPC
jgi:hypothetical protein